MISFIELTTDRLRVPMVIPEIGKDSEFCNYEVNDKVPSLRRFIGKSEFLAKHTGRRHSHCQSRKLKGNDLNEGRGEEKG